MRKPIYYYTEEQNELENSGGQLTDVDGILKKITDIETELGNKVDKEEGKGLSSNDYTDEDKNKVDTSEIGEADCLSSDDIDNITKSWGV